MKKRVSFIIVSAFIVIAVSILFYNSKNLANKEDITESVFDLPQSFWNIYIGELSQSALNSDGISYDAMQENGCDYVNYFVQATDVINRCYRYYFEKQDESSLQIAEEKMHIMMNTFYKYGKFPRPEYISAGYDYGWVSSMDAPTIMVGAQMLFEITEDEVYSDFVNKLSDYITLSTKKGGTTFIWMKILYGR